MSRASTPEKENQSNTTALKAKDIVKGKIPLVNLPELYLFVYSDDGIQNGDLAKVVNILAIKMQYRVVDFSVSGGSVFSGQFVVCMIKEEESEEEANSK